MQFDKQKFKNIERAGYLITFIIFSAILYFILSFFEKIPADWIYLHVLGLSIGIVLLSKCLKRLLK